MKLIAVITNPSEVGTILRHLIKPGRAPAGPILRALAMGCVAAAVVRKHNGKEGVLLE